MLNSLTDTDSMPVAVICLLGRGLNLSPGNFRSRKRRVLTADSGKVQLVRGEKSHVARGVNLCVAS
jgi:hypothetical protein